jgi:hypothetical protein
VVGAGNRAEDQASVKPLAMPLRNRFSHVELSVPAIDDWIQWANSEGIDGRLISFLKFQSKYLFTFEDAKKADLKAFATPRSWEMTDKKLKVCEELGLKPRSHIASCVGEGIAMEFQSFLNLSEEINFKEILDKPKLASKLKKPDLAYALIGGLVERVKQDGKLMSKAYKVAPHMFSKEYGVQLIRWLKDANSTMFWRLAKDQEFVKLMKGYKDLMLELKGEAK